MSVVTGRGSETCHRNLGYQIIKLSSTQFSVGDCKELPEKEQRAMVYLPVISTQCSGRVRLLEASNPSGVSIKQMKHCGVPRSVGSCYRWMLPRNRLQRARQVWAVECAPSVLGCALR